MATKKKENSEFSKYIKIFWKTFLFGLGFIILLFLFIAALIMSETTEEAVGFGPAPSPIKVNLLL